MELFVGPGSLYTSLLPNLLVEGVAATISGVDAVRIYVANLMTEPGETDGYTLDDHLHAIRLHAGYDLFDYILVNRRPVAGSAAARYALLGSQPVDGRPVRCGGLAAPRLSSATLAAEFDGRKIRHATRPLARTDSRADLRRAAPSAGPRRCSCRPVSRDPAGDPLLPRALPRFRPATASRRRR